MSKIATKRLEPVEYIPDETITVWDKDDEEWLRFDPESATWSCSGCGYELRGDDDGSWFREDGSCLASYCPRCGHPIEMDPNILHLSWQEDAKEA